jgi:hypothetical protein
MDMQTLYLIVPLALLLGAVATGLIGKLIGRISQKRCLTPFSRHLHPTPFAPNVRSPPAEEHNNFKVTA